MSQHENSETDTPAAAAPAEGTSTVQRRMRALVAIVPILAPVLLGAGGYYLNARQNATDEHIKKYHTTAEQMEATAKYFDYLSDPAPAKAKMGAYAIYMLNRENPELAVSLILAPERKELVSVLRDLAFRDSTVRKRLVARQVQDGEGGGAPTGSAQETAAPSTEAARSADEILRGVPRSGWSYLGNFDGKRWTNGPTLGRGWAGLPTEAGPYASRGRLAIRASAPDPETYRSGAVTGVIARGEMVRIDTVRANVAGRRVWAYVSVVPAPALPADSVKQPASTVRK